MMLSSQARDRLAVVLVGARNPQNIGAAARAMQDFGFRDLRVVNEFAPPFEAAQLEAKSAVAAGEVMRSARLFSSLPDAIADCGLVAGTTAIGGRGLNRPVVALREAAGSILAELFAAERGATNELAGEGSDATAPKVALLFGSEKTGLTNEQLSFCSRLLTIPMFQPEGRHLSMNLGQAVAVCLYELTRLGFEGARPLESSATPQATVQDRERLLTMVTATMETSGYARRFPANSRLEVVRMLVEGLCTSRDQVATWMGFFRQMLRRLPGDGPQGKTEDRDAESPTK